MLVSNNTYYKFSGEKLITSVVGFTLRLLGTKIVPLFKTTVQTRVDGIPAHEAIRVGDLLTIDVKVERLNNKVPDSAA